MKTKHDIKRGRHRKHASKETQDWNRSYLIPERPAWMPRETYLKLTSMRSEIEVR